MVHSEGVGISATAANAPSAAADPSVSSMFGGNMKQKANYEAMYHDAYCTQKQRKHWRIAWKTCCLAHPTLQLPSDIVRTCICTEIQCTTQWGGVVGFSLAFSQVAYNRQTDSKSR